MITEIISTQRDRNTVLRSAKEWINCKQLIKVTRLSVGSVTSALYFLLNDGLLERAMIHSETGKKVKIVRKVPHFRRIEK